MKYGCFVRVVVITSERWNRPDESGEGGSAASDAWPASGTTPGDRAWTSRSTASQRKPNIEGRKKLVREIERKLTEDEIRLRQVCRRQLPRDPLAGCRCAYRSSRTWWIQLSQAKVLCLESRVGLPVVRAAADSRERAWGCLA
jgi:hypothetical protein